MTEIKIIAGEEETPLEVNDGDGVLLFYFKNGVVSPVPLFLGNATMEGFVDAAILCLREVSIAAHREEENGEEKQDSSEG